MLWLNAMSFELWSKFRKLRTFASGLGQSSRNNDGLRNPQFKWYALYAWFFPAVISFITIIIQNLPEEYTKGKRHNL